MKAAHRVVKNTGILYAKMALTMFISLYSTRLVLSALGVEDFGLFNVVGGIIAMLGFLNASMAVSSQRFMSFAQGAGDIEKVKKIFNMSTLMHIGIALIIVLIFEIVGFFFMNGILNINSNRLSVAKMIYQFMVISTFFTIISVPYEAVITSHENMFFYAIEGILEALIKLAIAFYITYNSYDHLISYGFLMAGLSIFLLILRRVYCHWKYEECQIRIRHYYDKNLLMEMNSFAGWSLLGIASSMISNYGFGIIINIFFGTVVNAAQAIANQINGQLSVLSKTMINALNPIIAKNAGAGKMDVMIKAAMTGSKFSFYLLCIVFIPFLVEMPYILGLWLHVVPEYTVVFCRLLLVKTLIEQLQTPLTSTINAVGNIKKFQIFNSILNILPILVGYILFSNNFSPSSIYIYFIINAIFLFSFVIYNAKIYSNLPVVFFLRNIVLKSLIIFLTSIFVTYVPLLIFENELVHTFFAFILSSISLIIFIWFFGLNMEEKNIIMNVKLIFMSKFKQQYSK
jgi:O-antigen/teichoic acid export membrane protein